MFRKLDDFYKQHEIQVKSVLENLGELTADSLEETSHEGGRTIRQLVWHLVRTVSEMMSRTGLEMDEAVLKDPAPASPQELAASYEAAHRALIALIKEKWDDSTLELTDEMYGMTWSRGLTLAVLLKHEAHHHGQLTVLMRIAALPVHGPTGPSKEEWAKFGMEQPPEMD